jgi:hypothetical protein
MIIATSKARLVVASNVKSQRSTAHKSWDEKEGQQKKSSDSPGLPQIIAEQPRNPCN